MKKSIKYSKILTIVCIVISFCFVMKTEAAEKTGTRIHFISLNGATDAILLESDGHFGMVDSGEDWDYPNSEQYRLREGITTNEGYEQQVIH